MAESYSLPFGIPYLHRLKPSGFQHDMRGLQVQTLEVFAHGGNVFARTLNCAA